jgi:alpha-1,3-rhamnosyltransferase
LKKYECIVSVIIPACNHDKYIDDCIFSIVNQTYENLELIVVNDGSTDSTFEHLLNLVSICEKRFINFKLINKENEGVACTLNLALKYASGKYVYALASDDISWPLAISTLVEVAEKTSDVAVFCADADFIDKDGKSSNLAYKNNSFLTYYTRTRTNFDVNRDFGSYLSLLAGNYIPIGSLIRRSVFNDVGYYTKGVRIEDLDMWLRIAKKYRFKFINHTLASYRFHSENTITKAKSGLLVDTLNIYLREKVYCIQQGLSREWSDAYLLSLFSLLKNGGLIIFFKYAHNVNIYLLIKFLISNMLSKL